MKMRWGFFVTTICLLCVCYGQKYDTSGAVTFNGSPDSRTSCGGCSILISNFEFTWFDQAFTHVAATIVKFVNNATNATITSTIQGSSFTLPRSAAYAAQIVPNSVITTIIGGVVYTLTYPTKYYGIGNIRSDSSTPITGANGTVKCVVSQAEMTREFLLHNYISNGLELTPYIDGRCNVGMASPPMVLVRVSSLTATTTNYVDSPEARTSSAKKALPSNSLSPPTAPQTESSRPDNRPTTVLTSPSPQKNPNVPSITPSFAPSEPAYLDLSKLVQRPPRLHLRVSSLAATTTNHVNSPEARTFSTMNALPSNSISPPAAPQTGSSRPGNRPTTVLASPSPWKNPNVPSITPSFAPSRPVHSEFLGPVQPATTLIATGNREAEPVPSEPVHSDSIGSVPPATTLIASGNREADPAPSKPVHLDLLGSVSSATTLRASGNREADSAPPEHIRSNLLGPVRPFTTLISTGNREAEPPKKTEIPDQPQELGNGNLASPPGEPTPTVAVSQLPPTRPVFGTSETVGLSSDSSLPIGLSSIVNPAESFPISDRIFSRPNSRLVTYPTSLSSPELIINNPRPTSSPPLPSILTFINQEFSVPNPSGFFLSGTTEIHRGGSTIITSGTRSISLGNSATIIVHDSSVTPPAVHIVGPSSQVPGTQVTANSTFALPPAATAAGSHLKSFPGGQMKLAEVPMFIMFGATFFGIAVPWGLRYV